jgi:DEAD/DEAH box helicase domain-containing protein
MWTGRRIGDLRDNIASYRAGFLPEDRRNIEKRLADGSLLGVISTSALELGIDIGNLDICILVGYPGSMMRPGSGPAGSAAAGRNRWSC